MRSLALKLRRLHLRERSHSTLPLSALNQATDAHHLPHGLLAQQIIIVKMVKQNINPLLHVVHLRLELRRSNRLDAVDFGHEEVNDGLSIGRDVTAITTGMLGFLL